MVNKENPLVTIAIPTYNRAGTYLPQALQSALKQTYSNIEILVSDNCSSDNTEQLVQRFADPRIRYIRHPENIGAPNNWNFCINEARGVYLLLLQDDDMIDPDFIEMCMTAANGNSDVGTIRTGLRLIDSQGRVINQQANNVGGLSTEEFIFAWMNSKIWPYLCNTLLNTKRLQELGGLKSKHHIFCDLKAVMLLAARFGRVDIEEIKASARQHDEELTFSVKIIHLCEDALELLDLLCELVPDKKALVRHEGLKFFTKMHYHTVRAVQSPWKRISLYLMVFKKFSYAYSPITFLIKTSFIYKRLYSAARRVKRLAACFIVK